MASPRERSPSNTFALSATSATRSPTTGSMGWRGVARSIEQGSLSRALWNRQPPRRDLPSAVGAPPRVQRESPRVTQPGTGNVIPMASDLDIAPLTNERGFRLTGDLDFSTVPRFAAALRPFPPGDELNLDLADVIHIDS